MPKILEVIVNTLDDARQAEQGGADRVEVVSHLEQDGLTPPRDLVEAMLAAVGIPLRVMVRPSDVFTAADAAARAQIVADARALADLPIDGIVSGYLTADGAVDAELLREVADAAGHRVTFHRAIERVLQGDPLRTLRDAGCVDHILSGGGSGDWATRVARLEALGREASPIRVIVGGGVDDAGLAVLGRSRVITDVHVGRFVRDGRRVDGLVQADAVTRVRQSLARAECVPLPQEPSADRLR